MTINNAGAIAGYYQTPSGATYGFLYQNGAYTTLDPFGSSNVSIFGIDARGNVIGSFNIENAQGQSAVYGFVYGQLTGYQVLSDPHSLLPNGLPDTDGFGLNASGVAIGDYFGPGPHAFFGGQYDGYVYQDGNYTTINPPTSFRTTPLAIDDAGDIVGNYVAFDTFQGYGFEAIPTSSVPEPATWAMLLAGIFGAGAMVRFARRSTNKAARASVASQQEARRAS